MKNFLKLSDIFTDHMVLQRNKEFYIFGMSNSQDEIIIKVGGVERVCKAIDGKFKVKFPPMSVTEPVIITVVQGENNILVNDVVFGEVYIAGGQSNMEFVLKGCLEYNDMIKNVHDYIRYYEVPKVCCDDDVHNRNDKNRWQICDAVNVSDYSAVAYFFAEKIHDYVDCPIGIISCNWGGTSILSWLPKEEVKDIKSIDEIVIKLENDYFSVLDDEYDKMMNDYNKELNLYNDKVSKYSEFSNAPVKMLNYTKQIKYPWPPPYGKKSCLRPYGLYEYMVKTIIPYTVRGMLWYQGESDVEMKERYFDVLKKLIEVYRREFDNDDMYYLIVQVASCMQEEGQSITEIQESQFRAGFEIENCSTACIIDLSEAENIHPTRKKKVGERLGILAGHYIYNKEKIPCGPIVKDIYMCNGNINVAFDYVDDGLYALYGTPMGFEIEERDGNVYSVKAHIEGDMVVIDSNQIKNTKEAIILRYGYENFIISTMYNTKLLPMYPFRKQIKK